MPLVSAFLSEVKTQISAFIPFGRALCFILLSSVVLLPLTLILASPTRTCPLNHFPGPPGWPLVYLQWAAQYGDVFRIHLGYTPALVINSVEAAKQILHRNSQVVASRPSFYRFHTIVSKNLGTTIGASKFNTSLKRTRKEIASEGSKPAVRTHLADIDLETRHLLRDLMNSCGDGQTPVDMYMPVSRLGLSLMMTICYGRRMFLEDPLTTEIINVEDQLLGLRSPSGNYLDYLPLLRLFPFTPLA
ncbi:3-hydroxyphenylacetate 6-hydroxylase [Metarhizium brunneum]|uniref:3-hydroxyphenylacetate 6-hydroxylase n=1 Tax=Metarhizium brunneum TaxID=500148 RepID=A0A7D5ZBK4_9HYPO|nr:3-hydroxyphenylacetate 6-hydroxylase [Metarhizium brunneum]